MISASGWPIWQSLVFYSDLNKGDTFFGGDRKYLRRYKDIDMSEDEITLLPFLKENPLNQDE